MDAQIENILQQKIEIADELLNSLSNILDNKCGSQWGQEQVTDLERQFARMRELDDRWEYRVDQSVWADGATAHQIQLGQTLRLKYLAIQRLLADFELRLKGGKALIQESLREAVKSMVIKKYRIKANFRKASDSPAY